MTITPASQWRATTEKRIEVKDADGTKHEVLIRRLSPDDFMGLATGILPIPELIKGKKSEKKLAKKISEDPQKAIDLLDLAVQKGMVYPRLVGDDVTEFAEDEVAKRHLGPAYFDIASAILEFSGLKGGDAGPF